MVFLWILQSLINVLLVGLGVSYVLQKRRLMRLEGDLHRALMDLEEAKRNTHAAPLAKVEESAPVATTLNTPLGSATSTLSERKSSESDSTSSSLSTSARYSLAQKLLNEGVGLSEVARKSGISETELSLLRKFTQAPRNNYEAH